MCKEGATLADMRALDECYRKVVKPPVRLLQVRLLLLLCLCLTTMTVA